MNSKRKGNDGEREFLQHLKNRGIDAQRNDQMFKSGKDNPDISAKIGGRAIHFEVKRTERFRLYEALEQAKRDADGRRMPVVAHRMNRKPWVVVLTLEDFLGIMKGFDYSDLEKELDQIAFI